MSKLRVASKWGITALAWGAFALATSGRVQGQEPDCGPTREWNCVVPGCQDCPEILFEGTVCKKNEFEEQTGRECSPA